jgi:hypothetical protein
MSQSTNYPLVSVIVLTCNGIHLLKRNLPSVIEIEYPKFEVVIVDNGSLDGTAEYLRDTIKPLFKSQRIPFKLIRIERNVGIPKGRNVGIRNAKGTYITFLDDDARGDKTWLICAINQMRRDNSIGIIQCKVLLADGKRIDTVGVDQYWTGLAVRKGYGEMDRHQYDHIKKPIFVDGPGLIFRRELFEEIGLFDPKLFTADNGDFSWRAWMTGRWNIAFLPDSIIYHEGGGTLNKSPLYKNPYFKWQDKIYLMLKNYDSIGLLTYFPMSLLFLFAAALVSRRRGESLFAFSEALFSTSKSVREMFEKRKSIQKFSRVSTRQLIKAGIIKNPDLMMFKKGG